MRMKLRRSERERLQKAGDRAASVLSAATGCRMPPQWRRPSLMAAALL